MDYNYDTVAPSLMMSEVSHTRDNMYKLPKIVFKYDIRKYYLQKELLTCGTPYHPWLLKHHQLTVLRCD